MSHIADWLTAIGHNHYIVIIGAVEILAAVMLITENLMRRIRKKTTIDKKEIEAEMLRELDEREKEACILLRRSDMMPVYGTGNLQTLLGVSLCDKIDLQKTL